MERALKTRGAALPKLTKPAAGTQMSQRRIPSRGRPHCPYFFSDFDGARDVMKALIAKFGIGQVVKHRKYPFRGIIYDVDPVFSNTDEWWQSIPEEVRPRKDQPFYHLFAENAETEYVAYVSEQNLLPDTSGDPVRHPQVDEIFVRAKDGAYQIKTGRRN
jgi:heat shock protein HspQ